MMEEVLGEDVLELHGVLDQVTSWKYRKGKQAEGDLRGGESSEDGCVRRGSFVGHNRETCEERNGVKTFICFLILLFRNILNLILSCLCIKYTEVKLERK